MLGTEERSYVVAWWLVIVVRWLLHKTPQDFGLFRTRWSCALLAMLLWEEENIRLSPQTVRRGLVRMEFIGRRAAAGRRSAGRLRRIQRLVASLPADETVVFQDEVDVNLNTKIGSCWMVRGQQAEVVTPGNNEKRHLAGSLHWRTGRLILSATGKRRNADLFLTHLDDLRRSLRCYRVIHVVCDNARFHDCRKVNEYLVRWHQPFCSCEVPQRVIDCCNSQTFFERADRLPQIEVIAVPFFGSGSKVSVPGQRRAHCAARYHFRKLRLPLTIWHRDVRVQWALGEERAA